MNQSKEITTSQMTLVLYPRQSLQDFNHSANVPLSLIKHPQLNIDKINLYIKDPFESKQQLLDNRREKVGIKHDKIPKAFIDYSQAIDDVYENVMLNVYVKSI